MPRTNKRTCSTWAIVSSTLAFEVPPAGGCDVMYGIGGENGVVIVREESGLETPVGAISRLACAGVGYGAGHGVSGLFLPRINVARTRTCQLLPANFSSSRSRSFSLCLPLFKPGLQWVRWWASIWQGWHVRTNLSSSVMARSFSR